MGINPNNKITIIIKMLFAVTLFQHAELLGLYSHPRGCIAKGGLASWRRKPSVFNWRLH